MYIWLLFLLTTRLSTARGLQDQKPLSDRFLILKSKTTLLKKQTNISHPEKFKIIHLWKICQVRNKSKSGKKMQRDTLQNCVIHNCKIGREGASEYQTSPHFLSIYFIHLTYLSVCCVLGGSN